MILEELVSIWRFNADDSDLENVQTGIEAIRVSMGALTSMTAVAMGAIGGLLGLAGEREQVQIGFETMLGDAEKAKKLMQEVIGFADVTPFLTSEVVYASRMLLSAKVPTDQIIDRVRILGDVAAGTGANLQDMVRVYSQIYLQKGTRVEREKIKQFALAGVPIFPELAKKFGGDTKKMWKALDAGKIKFEDIHNALEGMTKQGGTYFNLMAKQSQSFLGLISTVKGKLDDFLKDVGSGFLPLGKDILQMGLAWFNMNRMVLKSSIVEMIETLNNFIRNSIRIFSAFIKTINTMVKVIGGWQKILKLVQIFLTLTMLIGIGRLITGLNYLILSFIGLGDVALIAQLKIQAFWILIGAVTVAIALFYEDFITWVRGGKAAFSSFFNNIFRSRTKVVAFFEKMSAIFYSFVKNPLKLLRIAFESLPDLVEDALGATIGVIKTMIVRLPGLIIRLVGLIFDAFKSLTKNMSKMDMFKLFWNIRKLFKNIKEMKESITDPGLFTPLKMAVDWKDIKAASKGIGEVFSNMEKNQRRRQVPTELIRPGLAGMGGATGELAGEATVNLNVTGMDTESAKEVAKEGVERALATKFRETGRNLGATGSF